MQDSGSWGSAESDNYDFAGFQEMQFLSKTVWILSLAATLSACGGGGEFRPVVNQIQAQSLHYGHVAVIYVAGQFMRSNMIADTGTCANPSFNPSSSPDLATLNCTVTATGALPITIKAADGAVLFSDTLTVPAPQVTLITANGSWVMELNPNLTPVTVNNFLEYVNTGYYKDTLFHRVIAGFVVQGGGYTTGLVKKAGQGAPIALESNKGLLNTRGTVAMARTSDPNSAKSEFFINLVDNPALDYQNDTSPGYAVFGKVVSGMDVVDAIAAVPTGTVGVVPDVPTTDIPITAAFQSK
jgi:peptidyl-prolyl cis-trans isomerase A (cyclophilin A)